MRPVDDDMGADEIEAMRLGQFRATVAEIGIVANCLHGLVKLVAVNQQLVSTPILAGVAEDAGNVLLGLR